MHIVAERQTSRFEQKQPFGEGFLPDPMGALCSANRTYRKSSPIISATLLIEGVVDRDV
jgi:hypothetical protein